MHLKTTLKLQICCSITVTDIHFICTKFIIDYMKFEEQEMIIIGTFERIIGHVCQH